MMRWWRRLVAWFRGPRGLGREGVFFFLANGRARAVDPLRTWFRLRDDAAFDWEADPHAADQGDVEALRRTIAAARKAFDLPDFDDGGPTDAEAIALLERFTAWTLDQKKTLAPSPTTSSTGGESLGPSRRPSDSASRSGSTALDSVAPQFID